MTLVAGIDPGAGGAIAVYDQSTRKIVSIVDMPFWHQTVGKKKRKRVDTIALMDLFDTLNLMGVELVVMEAVGGRPGQGAMFQFGYSVGLLYMACMYSGIMIETVPPQRWKKMLHIPGKKMNAKYSKEEKKQAMTDVINRANEMFPDDRALFRGPNGGFKNDRAEAAMLAKFGGDFVIPTMSPVKEDTEWKLAYRKAETGA